MVSAAAMNLEAKTIAMVGNPNSGKTTLFNELTGLRQKIANYPGVTVEKKEGTLTLPESKEAVAVLDLPGAYSLLPCSLDEAIVHDVLTGIQTGTPAPNLLVLVVDASNLERNLFFATQLIETGIPCVLALNMWDVLTGTATEVDLAQLSLSLRVPVVPTVGNHHQGIKELKAVIERSLQGQPVLSAPALEIVFQPVVENEIQEIASLLANEFSLSAPIARGEALRMLSDHQFRNPFVRKSSSLKARVLSALENLKQSGIDASSVEAELRYGFVQNLCEKIIHRPAVQRRTISEKIDEVLTHKIWGFLIFFALMGLIFQAIFTWSSVPMDLLSVIVDGIGGWVSDHMPDNQLRSLIVDGVIAGVGGVVIFLPQIICLFFFIALFEDSGYMARAAFVLDRVMRKVGLNGKSFIPLLGSFACAVPAIMATRTIEDKNDRFATIMVAPLMSCSARLPVYALMIAAFIPPVKVFGLFSLQGLTLFSMYALSIAAGLGMAAIFRKTLLKGSKTPFVLELPAYRMPNMRTVFRTLFEKASQFLVRAGTIIFTLSILLWFLVSYPRDQAQVAEFNQMKQTVAAAYSGPVLDEKLADLKSAFQSVQIRESYAGQLGHWIEPVIRPLGYDWKIGIGLIASFAAREVLVSTLSIVYSVGESENSQSQLIQRLQSERSPTTGKPVYTPLVALSVMVFFVLACQCISTVAIVKRETNSWRWPLFMVAYMTALAWTGSFVVFQVGTLMGY